MPALVLRSGRGCVVDGEGLPAGTVDVRAAHEERMAMVRSVRWWATLSALVGAAAACDTPAPVPLDAARDVVAPDSDAPMQDATMEPTDDRGGAEVGVDARDDVAPDMPDMADADVPVGADADVPTGADADVPTGGDADAATDADAGPSGPPRMTFTFVSAALNGGTMGGPQMRATITWHGMLRGENDAGVRLEAFFR